MGTLKLGKYPYRVRFGYGYALDTSGYVTINFFFEKKNWVRRGAAQVRLGAAGYGLGTQLIQSYVVFAFFFSFSFLNRA